MLNWKMGRGFCIGFALPPLIVLANVLAACEGEYRPYEPPELATNSNQPASAGGAPAGAATVSSGSSNDEQGIAPASIDPGEQADSAREDERCADGGPCPPLSLCEGDAGVCEANCPGCFIAGECFASGALDPENSCRICDPVRSLQSWSNRDDAACDDELFCTVNDVCRGGSCAGVTRNCDDGVACNGTSICDEDSDTCSAPVNQCGNNAVCDISTDTCVSTCSGCVIAGVCVPTGTEAPGDPCQVCDATRSTTSYTIASGKSCGAGPTVCSGQDTCDALGRCQPNHLPPDTPCGNPSSSACDRPDACDGNGSCQQRLAANATPCDDGAFCTVGDQCQGGLCIAAGQLNCGPNRTCSEVEDRCQCSGCQVGATCFSVGATNPANPCQVCDPNRSGTDFGVSPGLSCGSGATECSGQDTCDARGQCVQNNFTNGTPCTSAPRGTCQNGACVSATLPTGSPCQQDRDCSSGRCQTWYRDRDGDGFGTADDVQQTCSSQNGLSLPPQGYAANPGDCCDIDGTDAVQARTIFPGQTQFFDVPQAICPNIPLRDYDCSGDVEFLYQDATALGRGSCAFSGCNGQTVWDLAQSGGTPPACGAAGPIVSCSGAGSSCTATPQGFTVNFCH